MIEWILGLLLMGTASGSGPGPASSAPRLGAGPTLAATPSPSSRPAGSSGKGAPARVSAPEAILCRLDALTPAERARCDELGAMLLSRVAAVKELPRGYRLTLGPEGPALTAVAEWMELERRCCPFFRFSLGWSADRGATLAITGPPGAKELVSGMLAAREEAPSRAPARRDRREHREGDGVERR